MPRNSKVEVAGVNIRIPKEADRNYTALIETIRDVRRGVRVFGHSYVAISHFDSREGVGIFSKYTEIDVDGDWFDLEDFDSASEDDLDSIVIPENLRPNLDQFYFKIDADIHVLGFEKYGDSRSLSTRSIEKYFEESLTWPEVVNRFGRVEADIIKSYGEVERLLELPELKELKLTIRRPNPDDVGDGLAELIEERLREQNGDEYEEVLKARGKRSLKPNARTKALARVAAENGDVKAKSLVDGVMVPHETDESPLTEVRTYGPETSERVAFLELVGRLFARILGVRRGTSG